MLLQKIQPKEIPKHVAIIMDGNGRWAKKRGYPRILGHRAGTESVREIVRACGKIGVETLTLYTFSTENWARPKSEVNALMQLLCLTLRKEVKELDSAGVRLKIIGQTHLLPGNVQRELSQSMEKLKNNRGLTLVLALNYGGRQEILEAVNRILVSGQKKVDEKSFSKFLYTQDLRDPDLIIRTSGEQRISNFLIYQSAYSEFYTTPVLWPDFKKKDFYEAILDYQNRERRFGGHSD
ncbi:MAG: isoprenyl transferase [Elusimicrobia bacterium]|nr:isoprenyl transferase [Elusimicrobiota bacterium]